MNVLLLYFVIFLIGSILCQKVSDVMCSVPERLGAEVIHIPIGLVGLQEANNNYTLKVSAENVQVLR